MNILVGHDATEVDFQIYMVGTLEFLWTLFCPLSQCSGFDFLKSDALSKIDTAIED